MNIYQKTTTAGESVTINYVHGEADFSDLVYVVRCKDCKHRQPDEQKYMCVLTVTEQNCKQVYMNDNDYCSFGERKEEE